MTETELQDAIASALIEAQVVDEDSILRNDYRTPQIVSQERAPYLIWDVADTLSLDMQTSLDAPALIYTLSVTLLDFARGRSEKEFFDAFQATRDALMRALATYGVTTRKLRRASTASAVEPFYEDDARDDVSTLAQRFEVIILEVTL